MPNAPISRRGCTIASGNTSGSSYSRTCGSTSRSTYSRIARSSLDLVVVEVDALEGGDVDGHGRAPEAVRGDRDALKSDISARGAPAGARASPARRARGRRPGRRGAGRRGPSAAGAPPSAPGGASGEGAPASPRWRATAKPSGSCETPQRRSSSTALISPPTSRQRFEIQSQTSRTTAVAKAPYVRL